MKPVGSLTAAVVCAALILPQLAAAQTASPIPPSITAPDRISYNGLAHTRYFKDGMPSPATLAKIYDNLDAAHTSLHNAFVNTMQRVKM